MITLKKAYNDLKNVVDDFANSSSVNSISYLKKEKDKLWYAQWDNNYMGDLLDNSITKLCLSKIVDKYYSKQLNELIEDATELTSKSYPSLYQVYDHCCKTLDFSNPPVAYITKSLKGINALSVEVNEKQLILISRMVAVSLMTQEQAFLLGHELGHHQQGNLVCHTVNGLIENISHESEFIGSVLSETIEASLKMWCRNSELNADRAGYLCCKNIDSIRTLFGKIRDVKLRTNYYGIIEQYKTHPFIRTRLENIENFAKTLPL